MKNLLLKEFRLVIHPTTYMFIGLSALMLVPNYPYYVTFFYTTLGIFFSCLSGRENNDIFYTMTLPVRKRDVVKARFAFVTIIELIQVIVAIPFSVIRKGFNLPDNQVGMEANIAFFGISFILLGVFNIFFFTNYYKNPEKVGKTYGFSAIIFFILMGAAETLDHIVPFMRDKLDTKDPQFLTEKIVVLVIGIVLFAVLTMVSYKKSVKEFEKLDI